MPSFAIAFAGQFACARSRRPGSAALAGGAPSGLPWRHVKRKDVENVFRTDFCNPVEARANIDPPSFLFIADGTISQADHQRLARQVKMAVDNLTGAGAYAQGSVYKLQREPCNHTICVRVEPAAFTLLPPLPRGHTWPGAAAARRLGSPRRVRGPSSAGRP